MVVNFVVLLVVQWLVVVVVVVMVGLLALVVDFREVMMTSPPELAHCGGGGSFAHKSVNQFRTWSVKMICYA